MAAGDMHSRQAPAIREALGRLCSASLVVPDTPAASELVARHEYAVAAMRRTVGGLLAELSRLNAGAAE